MIERAVGAAAGRSHDMVIVGGGIYGSMLAVQAARRGLRPLLLERDDFGGGTTSNYLRIIHGGLRYLQTADLPRFAESVAERRWFLRTFPDLVRPLPCLMPLHGGLQPHPVLMRAALAVNDLLSIRRNRAVPADRRIPAGRVVSARRVAELFPAVRSAELKAGARWHDAVAERPERLFMETLRWARSAGATVLNRVEVTGVLTDGGAVAGVRAIDRVSGRETTFRAPTVINATGPWSRAFAARALGKDDPELFRPSLAFNLLLRRPPLSDHALALAPPVAGGRTYFVLPWGDRTLVGTWHAPWTHGEPLDRVPEPEISGMLEALNAAVPGWELRGQEVARVYAGLLPVRSDRGIELTHRPVIRFHDREGGPTGFVSVSGVKFTTARRVADAVLDRLLPAGAVPTGDRPTALDVPDREEMLRLCRDAPDRARAIVARIAREEAVVEPEDVWLRRTEWGHDPEGAEPIRALVRSTLAAKPSPDRA